MPPKKGKKGTKSEEDLGHPPPPPPNVFLYVQLADIQRLPTAGHPLEIHISQGESLIVKCDDHYNTDGIITEAEFHSKPTFTLIFQQDNVDRINQAANNPLLIKLFMREMALPEPASTEVEEELMVDEEGLDADIVVASSIESSIEVDDEYVFREPERLVLLSVGYLDVIKLFGHRRSMINEQLYLYPMPDVPEELRSTVHSEWHLYTLLPIAKQLTFTNMAFVTLESIYNLRDEYLLDEESMLVRLSFRSRVPGDKNDTQVIPLCEFGHLERKFISMQDSHQVFESFRRSVNPSSVTGLKSAMQVETYRLFGALSCTDGMTVDFSVIDQNFDEALVCNSFHRYILTQKMADILSYAVTCQIYVIAVEVFQTVGFAKPQKVFQGVLDPCIMAYPGGKSQSR